MADKLGVDMADATCAIEGCHGEHVARGYCAKHYQRWRVHGDPHSNPRQWISSDPCAVDGCDAARYIKQWCRKHYSRWKRHGDPLAGRRSSGDPLPPCSVQGCTTTTKRILLGMCEMHYNRVSTKGDVGPAYSLRIIGDDEARFWSYVDKDGPLSPHCIFRGPCWQWTSPLGVNGYGSFSANSKAVGPHRWAYENFVGPIPDDYEVDHLCHNRGCVNFEQHLEVVTHAVNGQRRAIPAQLLGWAAPLQERRGGAVAVTSTTLRLTKRLRNDLLAITNQQDRALTKAWVDAWDTVALDLEAAINELAANAQGGMLSRSTILRSRRLQFALGAIAQKLDQLSSDAGRLITDDLAAVVRAAGEAQEAIIDSQLPKAERDKLAGWSKVDPRAIEAIVQRSTERITSSLWPLSSEADAVIRRELVRGIASGSNPRVVASRIMKGAEGGFNGGLSRAMGIAQTETLDAHRAAAALSHQANADVLGGWLWLTSLSGRTCAACIGMSGTEHPLSEPGPQGHVRCRCGRQPLTKSWKDLGFDVEEPPSLVPNAGEWFAGLDQKEQRGILGAGRYDAWKNGDYPMDKWAVKVPNPDWRPSYQTSPLPKAI